MVWTPDVWEWYSQERCTPRGRLGAAQQSLLQLAADITSTLAKLTDQLERLGLFARFEAWSRSEECVVCSRPVIVRTGPTGSPSLSGIHPRATRHTASGRYTCLHPRPVLFDRSPPLLLLQLRVRLQTRPKAGPAKHARHAGPVGPVAYPRRPTPTKPACAWRRSSF